MRSDKRVVVRVIIYENIRHQDEIWKEETIDLVRKTVRSQKNKLKGNEYLNFVKSYRTIHKKENDKNKDSF